MPERNLKEMLQWTQRLWSPDTLSLPSSALLTRANDPPPSRTRLQPLHQTLEALFSAAGPCPLVGPFFHAAAMLCSLLLGLYLCGTPPTGWSALSPGGLSGSGAYLDPTLPWDFSESPSHHSYNLLRTIS